MDPVQESDRRVLALTPTGKDARATREVLSGAGIAATICTDMADLSRQLDSGVGAVLLTDESLRLEGHLAALTTALQRQPQWSDVPLVLLASGGANSPISMQALQVLQNVLVLDRPVHLPTLISAVRTALRSRQRQYEIRDHLQERELAARALQAAQEELVRKERLATLGRLAGSVAHEIRTPLAVIQNSVYFLEQTLGQTPAPSNETMRKVLAEMKRAVGKSNHIITEMLDYVQEPTPCDTVFPIGDAISRAIQLVSIPETVRPKSLTGESAELQVQANQDQVTRILVNLIRNAVQAMPQGGELEVIATREEGGKVCVEVRDTGIGIPEENLERIFEPMFSTKITGIGLGLAIAKRDAQLNGGHLSVESQVGCGTTFRLMINSAS